MGQSRVAQHSILIRWALHKFEAIVGLRTCPPGRIAASV